MSISQHRTESQQCTGSWKHKFGGYPDKCNHSRRETEDLSDFFPAFISESHTKKRVFMEGALFFRKPVVHSFADTLADQRNILSIILADKHTFWSEFHMADPLSCGDPILHSNTKYRAISPYYHINHSLLLWHWENFRQVCEMTGCDFEAVVKAGQPAYNRPWNIQSEMSSCIVGHPVQYFPRTIKNVNNADVHWSPHFLAQGKAIWAPVVVICNPYYCSSLRAGTFGFAWQMRYSL